MDLAWLHAQLGQKDEVLAQLEEVYRAHNSTIVLAVFPMFETLHSEASFHDLMRRVGLS